MLPEGFPFHQFNFTNSYIRPINIYDCMCLFYKDPPRVAVVAPAIEETQPGQLSCTVSSKPVSMISLHHNGKQVVSGITTSNNTLQYVINTASRDDSGTYRCTATNEIQSSSSDTHLVVRCKYLCVIYILLVETRIMFSFCIKLISLSKPTQFHC